MSKTSQSSALSTYLGKAKDFRSWDREFIQQARSLMLWPYIRPDSRIDWPLEPVKPSMRNYPKASIRVSTRASSTIADHEEIDPNGTPVNAMEMTPSGRQQYNYDLQDYRHEEKKWESHHAALHKLVDWMQKTVSKEYSNTMMDPEDTVDIWYDNLSAIGKDMNEINKHTAKLEYVAWIEQQIKSSKPVKDLMTWVDQWVQKVSLALEFDHTVRNSYDMVLDIERALKLTIGDWAPMYRMVNGAAISANKLTHIQIAAALRERAATEALIEKPQGRITRGGAFPALHGLPAESVGDNENDNDTEDSRPERPRGHGRGRGGYRGGRGQGNLRGGSYPKRPRADTNATDTNNLDCKLCGNPGHPLDKCWYAFPDLADPEWSPNKTTTSVVRRLIDLDANLKKEIDRVLKRRGKQRKKEDNPPDH